VHALANRNRQRLDVLLPEDRIHSAEGESKFFSDLVLKLEPDAIFHLASIHVEPDDFEDMMAMVETNIRIGAALLHGASGCVNMPVFLKTFTQPPSRLFTTSCFISAVATLFGH
jgi:nucleoside-diphosphate-sugar epimerase